MNLSYYLFALNFLLLWLCCASGLVIGQDNRWVDQLKGHVVILDSADLAGESNVRTVRKVLNREFPTVFTRHLTRRPARSLMKTKSSPVTIIPGNTIFRNLISRYSS